MQIEFEKPISLLEEVAVRELEKDWLEPVQVPKKKRTYSNKKAISPVMLRKPELN